MSFYFVSAVFAMVSRPLPVLIGIMGMASAGLCSGYSGPLVTITSEHGVKLLSIDAENAPLEAVLLKVAHEAGFQLTGVIPKETAITAHYSRAPIEQVIRQLLQDQGVSFVFVHRGAKVPQLGWVLLLGSGRGGSGDRGSVVVCHIQPDGRDAVGCPDRAGDAGLSSADPQGEDSPIEKWLAEARDPDAGTRANAIEALAQHGSQQNAREKVIEGASDGDAYVRTVSISALGLHLTEWPEAEVKIRNATGDADPSVRKLAVMILGERSTSDVVAEDIRNVALGDSDPEVRRLAEDLIRSKADQTDPAENTE